MQSDKNWLATLLLCLFLGGIGVHRFYVGKVGTGILQLIKDTKTKEYVIKKQIKNDTTKVEISKKSVTGEDELEDAHLVVTDKDGNKITNS